jgi:mercuric ion transport protein
MESRATVSRYVYTIAAWLFVVGILTQVFLVGLSLLGGQPGWQTHIGLGRNLGILALLMVVLAYTGQLPRPMKRFTWLNFAIYILLADVVIFMRELAPLVAALHPVLAVLLFGVTASLA